MAAALAKRLWDDRIIREFRSRCSGPYEKCLAPGKTTFMVYESGRKVTTCLLNVNGRCLNYQEKPAKRLRCTFGQGVV